MINNINIVIICVFCLDLVLAFKLRKGKRRESVPLLSLQKKIRCVIVIVIFYSQIVVLIIIIDASFDLNAA